MAWIRVGRHRRPGPFARLPSVRVETHDDLLRVLDEALPGLAERRAPLLVECVVGE